MEGLYTTRRLLQDNGAFQEGRYDLLEAVFSEAADEDAAVPLLRIFDLRGAQDTLWALRAVPAHQHAERDYLSRTLACEYVERVLPMFEGKYPADGRTLRAVLFVARRYADGKVTPSALRCAYVAAHEVSLGAPGPEYWSVARAAMMAATPDLPAEAALSATIAAYAYSALKDRHAERVWQAQRLRERLEGQA
jgi:hypothetical protein